MKRLAMISLSLLAGAASIFGAKKAPVVTNVEPPCWWAGMSDPSLQVMVTGPGIAAADVTADYPGVTLKEAISLDSPNYKLLYLDITPQAKPGTIDLKFNLNGRKAVVPYELKERTRKGEEYVGFDASDVLYLLMLTASPRATWTPQRLSTGWITPSLPTAPTPMAATEATYEA